MNHRSVFAFAVYCLFHFALLNGSSALGDRPNILFIAVDDLRPAMGCYGDEVAVTPNMDRLAGKGLTFNKAYCQVAVCNPSRASLMTGQRPDKLGVWTLPIHFREAKPDAITMPQWFRKHGYTAVSHGKIYHNPTPDPQSWSEPIRNLPDLPFPYPEGTRDTIQAAKKKLPKKDWRKTSLRPPCTAAPELADDQLLDGARTDMAIEDLRRLSKQDEPFFLAMGYIRPHLAWVAPKKYWDMYDPAKLPVNLDEQINPNTPPYALHNNSELAHYVDLVDMPKPWSEETISPDKARQMVHGYYACVSYVDVLIGKLIAALEEEGVADNTIIVLWSDHGYKLGEYRGWGKMTNYELDARVPLIIATPQMRTEGSTIAGQKTDGLAELLDLFPTVCELADVEVPDFVDGKSLVPTLENPETSVHAGAVSQYYRNQKGKKYMGYALRTATHRFVQWRNFSTGEVTAIELYDHQNDPGERNNIADSASQELLDQLNETLLKTHPKKELKMTPLVHSEPNFELGEAKLTFVNQTSGPIVISPISSRGARLKTKKKRLLPEREIEIDTRVGNVFVIESDDGLIHEVYSLAKEVETKVVGGDE